MPGIKSRAPEITTAITVDKNGKRFITQLPTYLVERITEVQKNILRTSPEDFEVRIKKNKNGRYVVKKIRKGPKNV